MWNSLLLTGFIFAVAVLCAWAAVHFGRKAGQPERKLRRIRLAFVVFGAVFALYSFIVDYSLRRTTLFEVVFEGSVGALGETSRVATFAIEHEDVEHSLLVVPKPGPLEEAAIPIPLRIRLVGADGETWLEERRSFEVRPETNPRPVGVPRKIWEEHTFPFTPRQIGNARLEIVLENPGIHAVHVRVEDPLKRDGQRASGY